MTQIHWPMPGRDTTEFPTIDISADISFREHLEDFLHIPDQVSENDYEKINQSFPSGKEYTPQRIRTFRKMYERLGLIYPKDSKLKQTELGNRIYQLQNRFNNLKESELSNICQMAVSLLKKYQFANPLDMPPSDEKYKKLTVHPYYFLWILMLKLDFKIHFEEINRVVLWAEKDEDISNIVDRLVSARKKINYKDANESELDSELGPPVFTQQISARIAPLYSNAGWGGLIISNKVDDDGFRYITETAKPHIVNLEQSPPQFLETESEEEWIEYYYSDLKQSGSHTGNITLQPISKPFVLLAGISGTGKTRFVRKQAEATGQLNETYCLTSVRPDWHEPSDLLGYISRLSGKAEYVTTDVLQFIAKAWRSIIDSGITVDVVNLGERGERLSVSGDKNTLIAIKPYWLCLDEMNLAPVEQYFADYLSVLETREWDWNGDQFTYSSDALLKPAAINELDNKEKLRKDLGFESVIYDATWQAICQYGLQIPFNLIVAGTVNMDETTHGFSRKVIDRALSFDFGDFFPNDYSEYFEPSNINKTISFPFWSDAKTSIEQLKSTADENGNKSIEFLNSVNAVLKNTPFELAYRALNELLLAVISAQPKDDIALKAVWDDFLMCKVLPRIEGDVDKLGSEKSLLVKLESELSKQLSPIWDAATDSSNARPDLYREKLVEEDAPEDEKAIRIQCRSKGKIEWMNERLSSAGFTSFWP